MKKIIKLLYIIPFLLSAPTSAQKKSSVAQVEQLDANILALEIVDEEKSCKCELLESFQDRKNFKKVKLAYYTIKIDEKITLLTKLMNNNKTSNEYTKNVKIHNEASELVKIVDLSLIDVTAEATRSDLLSIKEEAEKLIKNSEMKLKTP